MNSPLPIVRLEVEHLRQSVIAMFSDYQAKADEIFRTVLSEACSDANVKRVMAEAVQRELELAINGAVKNHFRYGDGATVIQAEVNKAIQRALKTKKSKQ